MFYRELYSEIDCKNIYFFNEASAPSSTSCDILDIMRTLMSNTGSQSDENP